MNGIDEPTGRSERLFKMVEWLSGMRYGATVRQIAEAVNKSEKTVRRDLSEIDKSMGIQLVKQRGADRKYRYRIKKESTKFRFPSLNTYEILALYFIRGFSHFKEIPFIQKNLSGVFSKISDTKMGTDNDFLTRISNLFIMPRELGGRVMIDWNNMDFLERLVSSALYYTVCEVTYQSGGGDRDFRIGVLHFFNYRDAVYILGMNMDKSEEEGDVVYINLAMHRIKSVKLADDETFEYPSDFDADSFFDSDIFCFDEDKEKIMLKFVPHTRQYILEREWFPNQQVEQLNDGSVILTFESDVNMILTGWIRGFGPDVEVLEPEELRKQMIEDLENSLEKYGK